MKQYVDQLRYQIAELKRNLFGSRSEKFDNPMQNVLDFNETNYPIDVTGMTELEAKIPSHKRIMNEPDRKATTKSYVYCFRGGGPGEGSIIYEYNEKEHKKFVKDWFDGFSGAVHSDTDSFFNGLYAREDVWLLLCNSHSRRKYEAITKTSLKEGLAHEAMCFYSQLYKIEKIVKAKNYSFE
jgi:hypothetical protein